MRHARPNTPPFLASVTIRSVERRKVTTMARITYAWILRKLLQLFGRLKIESARRKRRQSNRPLRKPRPRLKQKRTASRRRRQSKRPLRKPRPRLKQKRSASWRRRQSNRPLRKPSERRRRNASGRRHCLSSLRWVSRTRAGMPCCLTSRTIMSPQSFIDSAKMSLPFKGARGAVAQLQRELRVRPRW
jgi:hypothetical protein